MPHRLRPAALPLAAGPGRLSAPDAPGLAGLDLRDAGAAGRGIDPRRMPSLRAADRWVTCWRGAVRNLETPLPVIDIVNECLEFMASSVPAGTSGTIDNTSPDQLAGYTFCKKCADEGREDQRHNGCEDHDREGVITMKTGMAPAAMSPGSCSRPCPRALQPGDAGRGAPGQQAYINLGNDFSACCLPYSQPLDIAPDLPPPHLRTSQLPRGDAHVPRGDHRVRPGPDAPALPRGALPGPSPAAPPGPDRHRPRNTSTSYARRVRRHLHSGHLEGARAGPAWTLAALRIPFGDGAQPGVDEHRPGVARVPQADLP